MLSGLKVIVRLFELIKLKHLVHDRPNSANLESAVHICKLLLVACTRTTLYEHTIEV